jgi:hypothetical protein
MLNRRSVLRATMASAVAGAGLLATSDCSAAQSPSAGASAVTTPMIVADTARLATGSAAVGCGGFGKGGLIFGVHSDGTIWGYPSARVPDACQVIWSPESQIGDGWDVMRRVFADHRVTDDLYAVFAIDYLGNLFWYAYDPHQLAWVTGAGQLIGRGWHEFTFVTYAGDGVFYAVDTAGNLLWYRNLDPFGGSATWDDGSGTVIGVGWQDFRLLFSSGGSIYAITTDGFLLWYGYSDPTRPDGTFASASGRPIGTGWDIMVAVDAVPGNTQTGVLVHGVDDQGNLREYLDIDPNGTANWAGGSGTIIGTHNWLT